MKFGYFHHGHSVLSIKIDIYLIAYMVNALKNLNRSCLPQKPRQTGQTQIRLILKKAVIPGCYSDKHFVSSSPDNRHFYLRRK